MKRQRINNNRKKPIGFLIFVLVLLIGVVSVQISNLYTKNNELEKEVIELEAEIESLLQQQMDLLEHKEFINSNEYIEQLAREKFGLIKPDETLFVSE